MVNTKKYAFVALIIVLLISPELQSQCAMCRQSAESTLKNDPSSIVRGLNSGILYLMAVPYLMIAFIFRKQIYQLWKKLTVKPAKSKTD